jgi:hypothetical protein
VRFIYQGQFLKDNNTVSSYNIRDKTTIHCHITAQQKQSPSIHNDTIFADANVDAAVPSTTMPSDPNRPSTSATNQNATNRNSSSISRVNSLISIEFGTLLLPLFTVLLASTWYFRMNFKQFFSPLSNLFLIFITAVYTLFLFVHFYQMFTFAHNINLTRTMRT